MKRGAENVLFKLNEELLRSNKALEQFAYVASHDLQEPLRMVASFTQLLSLKYKDKLDDDARDYIRFAVEGAERMYEMINGLLAYSRIHTGDRELKEVDMNYVMEQVRKNLALQINKSKAFVSHERLPVILADEGQMIQLIQNLVSNAIKFSDSRPKIRISCSSGPRLSTFSVAEWELAIRSGIFRKDL